MKNYLVKIRNFLKYGFIDEGYNLLGASKLDKNQGKNDGNLCVLAYHFSDVNNDIEQDCVQRKDALVKSSYALHRRITDEIKKDALEKSSYSLVKNMKEGK